ncbi:hypothetical protein F1559_004518 [Cyanidiococcus yangmingshanensis]|uniref:Uncharacterized protein n=1 Tax=Cyanidiococcus yangmingshanensis TaxID=2690220 RepID=A0A7J7IQY4_9RHOD|nr:hypothetical protein F1559_004518 [Cyanidiococcus yangmingshanensis]
MSRCSKEKQVPSTSRSLVDIVSGPVDGSSVSQKEGAPASGNEVLSGLAHGSERMDDDPHGRSDAEQRYLMATDIAACLADILLSENTITPGMRETVRALTNTDERDSFMTFVVERLLRNRDRSIGLCEASAQRRIPKRRRIDAVSTGTHPPGRAHASQRST